MALRRAADGLLTVRSVADSLVTFAHV